MKQLLLLLAITGSALGSNAKATADTSKVNLQVGAPAKSATLTLADSTTGGTISGAVISNLIIQNPHPEIISITAVNAPGSTVYSIKATPVAAGSGTATITCLASYTDPGDGLQKSENKTITITYTVVYTPPHGAKLSLTFN